MRRMEDVGHCQIIMATHSPMLMAYPNATLLRLTKYVLEPIAQWRSAATGRSHMPGSLVL